MREVDSKLYQQEIKISPDALKLQSNFKLLICGSSGQGKTEWIVSLISSRKAHMVDDFEEVIYCIPPHCSHLKSVTSTIEKMKEAVNSLVVFEGILVDIDSIFKPTKENSHCLIIYDDMYSDLINSRAFCHLATFGSRHHNCSLIITSQNLYETGRFALTLRRQMSYFLIFFPSSEKQQLITLGRNLFPTNSYCIYRSFKKLIPHTTNPYQQNILVDVNPRSPLPHGMRLRSNFFSEEPYFFIVEDD